MGVKLFVGGLSFTTSSEGLRDAFARYGNVQSAMVMTDRETRRSRGFGFVEMATPEEAERAISGMNGATLDGRMIRVDKATPRGTAPPPRPGGAPSGPRPGGPRPWSPGPPVGGGGRFGGPPPMLERPGGPPAGRGGGRRRGDGERDRKGGPKRGRPLGERRAEDKGRRSTEDYRW